MRVYLSHLFEKLAASFWVLPTAVAVAIVLPLFWLQNIQAPRDGSIWEYFLLYDASPQGARLILSSIATALMTVVGVLFSIMIVVLQQISLQYTPRIIQNFLRSTPSQWVLGFYLGTFTYCLLLLRKVHDKDADVEVKIPQLAMSLAIVLAVICLCLLIYFVHHITTMMQSTRIIERVTQGAISSINDMVSDRKECPMTQDRASLTKDMDQEWICTEERGYLQAFEWTRLRQRNVGRDPIYLQVLRGIGEYVQKGEPILRCYRQGGADAGIGEKVRKRIQSHILVGVSRTHTQDPEFGIQQLVDIGLRALSPGVNDPSTAIEAIHGVGAILDEYNDLFPIPQVVQVGPEQFIELPKSEADQFVGLCFDQLISSASEQLPVRLSITSTLKLAISRAKDSRVRSALTRRLERLS